MAKTSMQTRRSRLELAAEILSHCHEPASANHLRLKVGLSTEQSRSIIEYLVHRRFIELYAEASGIVHYRITELGKDFLQGLEIVILMWRGIALEVEVVGHGKN